MGGYPSWGRTVLLAPPEFRHTTAQAVGHRSSILFGRLRIGEARDTYERGPRSSVGTSRERRCRLHPADSLHLPGRRCRDWGRCENRRYDPVPSNLQPPTRRPTATLHQPGLATLVRAFCGNLCAALRGAQAAAPVRLPRVNERVPQHVVVGVRDHGLLAVLPAQRQVALVGIEYDLVIRRPAATATLIGAARDGHSASGASKRGAFLHVYA